MLSIAFCAIQYAFFGLPVWMTAIAILLAVPLMLVGLRALGETNWGPIGALSNLMQGLFAAIAPGNINANILGNGSTGTIAVTSEGLMQDYKAAHLIGSTPRSMTIAQLIGAPIGAAALLGLLPGAGEDLRPDRRARQAGGARLAALGRARRAARAPASTSCRNRRSGRC